MQIERIGLRNVRNQIQNLLKDPSIFPESATRLKNALTISVALEGDSNKASEFAMEMTRLVALLDNRADLPSWSSHRPDSPRRKVLKGHRGGNV